MLHLGRIYTLEKAIHQPSIPSQDPENAPLLDGDEDPDPVFSRALDTELEKICSFYQLKELEIYGEVEALTKDQESYRTEAEEHDHEPHDLASGLHNVGKGGRLRSGSIFKNFGFGKRRKSSVSYGELDDDGDSDDDAEESTALNRNKSGRERRKTYDERAGQSPDDLRSSREWPNPRRRTSQAYEDYSDQAVSVLYDSGITLKKRTISLYVSLCELKSFIQLNKTGFSKALKKYDKTLNRNLRPLYIEQHVTPAYPFQKSTVQRLDENVAKIEKDYAAVVTKGDISIARRELRLHLREHVVWERNTVWREMIGIERKAQAANMGIRQTLLGGNPDPSKARLQGDDSELMETKELSTPVGRFTCPSWLFSSTLYTLVGIFIIFVVLLVVPIMKKQEQQNCLAMLAFVSLLWATEVRSRLPLSMPLTDDI